MTTNKLLLCALGAVTAIPVWLYACWTLWGWFIRLHCGGVM